MKGSLIINHKFVVSDILRGEEGKWNVGAENPKLKDL